MKIYSCLLIAVLSLCVTARGDETASPAERVAQKTIARGRALLRAGRYHEARQLLDGREWAMQDELLRLIDAAKHEKQNSRALRLYQIQFGFFPLGAQDDWSYEMDKWQKRVLDYTRLLNTSPRPEDRRRASEERHAFELFRAFDKVRDMATAPQAIALARQMANKFPRSIFTLLAIVSGGDVSFYEGHDKVLRFLAACLKPLEKGDAPARHRILVLQQIAQTAELEWSDAHWRTAYGAHRRIEKLSDVASEKASALASAAKALMGFDERDAPARSRALFYEVLRKYPRSYAATEARKGIVDNWLNAEKPDAAMQAVHAFEKTAAPFEIAELMLIVAHYLDGEVHNPAAQPVLEEIARRFPRQGAAAQANAQLAAIYGERSDDAAMLALYQKVASLQKQDIDGGEMYMREAQSTSFARLGSYYMKHEQWGEALKWWRGYHSSSWCGNGQDESNSANVERIALCLTKLGRESEAIQTLEDWTLQPHIETTPGVIVTLVESYRERGQLSTLEAKLRAAPIEKKSLRAAQMALDYIELLHAKERGDIAVLWKPFERKSHRTLEYLQWQTKYGAKFLIEMGDKAKPFLLDKAKSPPKNEEDETADASSWACLLLAQMSASEVLPVLQEKLKTIQSAQALKYRLWALRLLNSQESMAILDAQAKNKNTHWAVMARKVLALYPRDMKMEFLTTDEQLLNSGPGLEKSWQFDEYLKD